MGLCKCPKRRVTNQFCFEHRVNVCEYCMVTKHPKCIVQSYLHWLQDSDYNPICEFCAKNLSSEDCIRLTCYHVYHWWCLDSWARNFPADTAPAGYTCPACSMPLFPAPNLVSPVADVLKEKLAGVNWARTGLGLPLLSEDLAAVRPIYPDSYAEANVPVSSPSSPTPHSIVQMPEMNSNAPFSRNEISHSSSAPRRGINQENQEITRDIVFDHDEDKYKRRSASEWILRKWKGIWTPGRGRRHWRPIMAICLVLLVVVFMLGIFGKLTLDENDPTFDVHQHPQIKQQDS